STCSKSYPKARRETGKRPAFNWHSVGSWRLLRMSVTLGSKRPFLAHELSSQIRDDAQLFHALAGLWYRYQIGGEFDTALEIGKELLGLAQRADDPSRLRFAHGALGQALMLGGEIASAMEHIKQLLRIIGPADRAVSYHIGDAPSRWLAISAFAFW